MKKYRQLFFAFITVLLLAAAALLMTRPKPFEKKTGGIGDTDEKEQQKYIVESYGENDASIENTDDSEQPHGSAKWYEKNGEPIGDIDGNGQQEYVVYSGEDGANTHFDFIFNGEKIYEHDDECVVELGDLAAYIDLNEDGEEEILLTMTPHVNSMPLMEYAVLKKKDGGWQKLELYKGEDGLNNSFPISVTKGADTFDAVISCEGSEKQIHIDLEPVYSYWKTLAKEDEEGYAQICNYYDMEVLAMAEGACCGVTCDWGIWDIELNSFHGKPCLKAEQGIEGFGKEDFWGSLYLYFDYDKAGKIRVLDMEFEPNDCYNF